MAEWVQTGWEWLREREALFAWLGALSLLTLLASALAVPVVVRRMPHDYFLENGRATEAVRERHPVLRILFHLVKNLVGGALLLGGFIMLFTPGQGVLTILVGLGLMDFPGKKRLELRLIRLPAVHRAVDWIRRRGGQPPLQLPEE